MWTTATAISSASSRSARRKRAEWCAADRTASRAAERNARGSRSARAVVSKRAHLSDAGALRLLFFAKDSVVVDLHRRASVQVMVARHGLTQAQPLRGTERGPRHPR